MECFVKIVKFHRSAWLCTAVHAGVIRIFRKMLLPVMSHLKGVDHLAM